MAAALVKAPPNVTRSDRKGANSVSVAAIGSSASTKTDQYLAEKQNTASVIAVASGAITKRFILDVLYRNLCKLSHRSALRRDSCV